FSQGVYSNGYLEINVDTDSAPERFSFDLKQLPTIPEPATLTMLAMGAGAMLCRRRRRDR
ncbi:MAG: PEP-CTERM sorting domain-containing protein, partial [Planctomycetota bacterium]